MDKTPPLRIADYPVERISAGRHGLGHVVINDEISVIFRMNDDGTSPEIDCLACKISKISECAQEVCPPIKAQNPDASCSDAIMACAAAKCASECSGVTFGGGGMLVIA
jgi:hypothetical protein